MASCGAEGKYPSSSMTLSRTNSARSGTRQVSGSLRITSPKLVLDIHTLGSVDLTEQLGSQVHHDVCMWRFDRGNNTDLAVHHLLDGVPDDGHAESIFVGDYLWKGSHDIHSIPSRE